METWSKNLDMKFLSEKYNTPVYIFSIEQLRKNFDDYSKLTDKKNIAFPIKANPSIEVLRQILKLGGSVDCASVSEVRLAFTVGFLPENIIYNTPLPDINYAVQFLKKGCTFVVDSENILGKIEKSFQGNPFTGKIYVRINPEIPIEYAHKEDWHNLTSHCSSTGKFGIPSEDLIDILNKIKIPVTGLHVHVGTQMDNILSFINIINFLHQLVDEVHLNTSSIINDIDLGGGLGIDFTCNDKYPSIAELNKEIIPLMRNNLNYIFEPGHSLIGNTMGILTKVSALKNMRGKKWGIIDVGTDQLSKITFLNWSHGIIDSNHEQLPLEGPDSLGGPLCFSGDTLLNNTSLENISEGDLLFIQHCGAYCFSLSNHFNGKHFGGMIKIINDGSYVRSNDPEIEILSPVFSTHCWENDFELFDEIIDLGKDTANELNSKYLQYDESNDHYDIINFERISNNCYKITFKLDSNVDFVSMPFAVRLAGDAAIISALSQTGKNKKDISIWADKLVLNSGKTMTPDQSITCVISLSPTSDRNNENDKSVLARFSLDEGKFSGYFRLKFSLC